jgi:D-beta-D-heptose 7-phosphate kinase/D-beta-D-heptose 1-phosphate adenosyltransferase
VVGDDEPGRRLARQAGQLGLGLNGLVVDPRRPTTHKTRIMAADRQLLRFDAESREPLCPEVAEELWRRVEATLSRPGGRADVVLLSDYAKGVLGEALCRRVIAAARAAGTPSLCDPKGRGWARYRGATALTPNRREAAEVTGLCLDDPTSLRAALELLVEEYRLEHCLVTLAEDGLALLSSGRLHLFAAHAAQVRDVTGAGDTVVAALALALGCGLDIRTGCRFASAAAAVSVGRLGVAAVGLDEVEDALMDVEASLAIAPLVEPDDEAPVPAPIAPLVGLAEGLS